MPTYVAANEHLAEALHVLGRDEEATAIYENVVRLSDDPEFAHALAELYSGRGKPNEARALEAKALAGEAMLLKYPEAMYWHASEFYLSNGKTARALELLKKNLALRPNASSYVALARAQLAEKQAAEAKVSIDTALAMPLRSGTLFWTASMVYRSVGDGAAAAQYRDRALGLNPKVEAAEPARDRDVAANRGTGSVP